MLLTHDGNHVRIPNATVMKGVITNYTQRPERRFTFTVGVDPDTDLLAAEELAIDTLREAEGVLTDPSPASRVEMLEGDNIQIWVAGWVDQRRHHFRKTRGEARRLVKEAFDAADIKMPVPTQRLRFDKDAGLPEGEEELSSLSAGPRGRMRATVYFAPDTELDKLIETERAGTMSTDLLDPKAPRE